MSSDQISASPSTSSFVPLSMLDSVRPATRTIHRANSSNTSTQQRAPRPSYLPQHSSGSINTVSSKEKADAARREARAMMETLGLAEEPAGESPAKREAPGGGAGGGAEAAGLRNEVARLKLALSEMGGELSKARSEVADLGHDKVELQKRCALLEKDKGAAVVGPSHGAGGGMTAKQVEELERQFAAQESLLNGYAKESERSFAETEQLKQRQRKMADLLARLAGPNWEADFLSSALPPSILPAATGTAFASPALRAKLGGRPSLPGPTLAGTPRAFDSPRVAKSSDEPTVEEGEERADALEGGDAERSRHEASAAAVAAAADAGLVRQQLESVQALIRGMQERLLKRDGELDGVERRAREEAARAGERLREVDLAVARAGALAV